MELMSSEINEIALALCKAQAQMGPAVKDKKNPFYKSTYADLSSCIAALREPFSNNDLCFFQSTMPGENGIVKIITTIAHKSGQWFRGQIDIKPVKNDPQGAGSAISYGKRYGLQALAGLPTDDDDGEMAMSRSNISPAKRTTVANVWEDGARDKFVIRCEELGHDTAAQASIVKFYLSETGLKYMTKSASTELLDMLPDVVSKYLETTNG